MRPVDPSFAEEGARRSPVSTIHATLKALVNAFNAHDLDRIMSFFADDAVLEMPRGPHPCGARYEGAAAVRGALEGRFKGLPDVHYGQDVHYVDGDTGISQWTLTGTPASGRRIEVRGCDFYTFRDGKVIKKDSFWKIVE
jgi:ketosteroid isomerase-like protein